MKYRNLEHIEQKTLIEWADMQPLARYTFKAGKVGDFLFHIANGGARSAVTGAILRSDGVRKGMLDLCFCLPNKNHHALYIEMKAPTKTARVSKEQRCWIDRLNEAGYLACVAYGFSQAKEIIEKYLRNEV